MCEIGITVIGAPERQLRYVHEEGGKSNFEEAMMSNDGTVRNAESSNNA